MRNAKVTVALPEGCIVVSKHESKGRHVTAEIKP